MKTAKEMLEISTQANSITPEQMKSKLLKEIEEVIERNAIHGKYGCYVNLYNFFAIQRALFSEKYYSKLRVFMPEVKKLLEQKGYEVSLTYAMKDCQREVDGISINWSEIK